MIRGVHHVALATGDIDRLVAFYREAFGFEVLSRGGWEPDGNVIELLEIIDDRSSMRLPVL